ncbi:protease SohB [Luminiphilus sp.]|nr:protease SohB [Luminiphilus sp.]MDB2377132.1 protease SohB [Luminiphilus sp.]MDB2615710.1 protease SohB [Luminiphilus sp.]MDB3922628.1 protease SohB [Luminiphilus sp.]
MEFFQEIGLFLAEAVILVTAIIVVIIAIAAASQRRKGGEEGYIEVRRLNDRYTAFHDAVRSFTEHAETRKVREKAEKKSAKAEEKQARQQAKEEAGNEDGKQGDGRLFVLRFEGDIRASETESLREEISAIAPELREGDEVLLCLESPGGMVHSYGLAASQLHRIRATGASLTVAVDKVAASGGYMMACVADRIISAPFAVIGSIGVVAQLPNFHRLLKKNDVDFELLTAGKYKRTLTMFGENTDDGRAKFVEDLEDTYDLFKDFVVLNRPVVDIEAVATGEIWYGQRALDQNLVDELSTSDAYLQTRLGETEAFEVRYVPKKSWQEKFGMAAEAGIERTFLRLWQQGASRFLP